MNLNRRLRVVSLIALLLSLGNVLRGDERVIGSGLSCKAYYVIFDSRTDAAGFEEVRTYLVITNHGTEDVMIPTSGFSKTMTASHSGDLDVYYLILPRTLKDGTKEVLPLSSMAPVTLRANESTVLYRAGDFLKVKQRSVKITYEIGSYVAERYGFPECSMQVTAKPGSPF
jgi:hypothetical protein